MLKFIPTVFTFAVLFTFFFHKVYAQTFIMNAPADEYTNNAWLDLRYLNETEAGENGFIKLSPDGKSFVNGKGVPQWFWDLKSAGLWPKNIKF